jgi:LCP family protein required for cell wall assembly
MLSFLFPGLGQAALGRATVAVALGAPVALFTGAAIAFLTMGRASFVQLLRPEVLVELLVLNGVFLVLHLVAVTDAWASAWRRHPAESARARRSARARVVLAALVVATVAMHGAAGWVGIRAWQTLDRIFEPGGGWPIPEPSFPSPSPRPSRPPLGTPSPTPRATPAPTPSPTPSPVPSWAEDGRLNLLLIGGDSGPDRWSLRTDTMIVLSIDVRTGRAALFGVPRNLVGVPLPPESAAAFPGGRFPGLLNALYVYAMGHPAQFPGGDARGFRAVAGAVQQLVGVRLDGMIGVNLAGFVRLVDAIGGLWIDVPERVVDAHYPLEDGSGHIAIDIRPGCQLLDGRMALAFARSRHQDSDYGRMRRQQAVLEALARQLDPLELVARLPELFEIAEDNVWTTIPREDAADMAAVAARVRLGSIRKVLFVPPTYPSQLTDAAIDRIRATVRDVFDVPSPGGGAGQTPTPRPSSPATCP